MITFGGIFGFRGTKVIAGAAFALGLAAAPSHASKRVISFYSLNTGESLTVTYKRNGRYIPRAMKQLDYILRDWRANSSRRMDPKVIDLVWDLHNELGSNKPIHLVSGYRSPKTNAKRRRQSRGVAKRSRHIHGQAIDLYFPDVALKTLRESALIKQRGGVGYYPRSRKPFVHIDTGTVRHWPRMPAQAYARLLKRGKSYTRLAAIRRKPQSRPAIRLARATPALPQRGKRPAAKIRSPFPVLALKNPPIPQRKPILVALNAAPRGESWLTPSNGPGKETRSRIIAASNTSILTPSTWENVKKRIYNGTDTLMAFVGRQHKPVKKAPTMSARLAKTASAPVTATIVSSSQKQMTTASIRPSQKTPVAKKAAPYTEHLFTASIKPQHVWSATPQIVVSLMRAPVLHDSPSFSGSLFARVEKAAFVIAPSQMTLAALDGHDAHEIKRKIKIKAEKPGWVARLLSDWGFSRPANAETTRKASIFN